MAPHHRRPPAAGLGVDAQRHAVVGDVVEVGKGAHGADESRRSTCRGRPRAFASTGRRWRVYRQPGGGGGGTIVIVEQRQRIDKQATTTSKGAVHVQITDRLHRPARPAQAGGPGGLGERASSAIQTLAIDSSIRLARAEAAGRRVTGPAGARHACVVGGRAQPLHPRPEGRHGRGRRRRAGRGPAGHEGPGGQRGLRRARRHVQALLGRLPPRLDRRRRHGAPWPRPLRLEVQQRVLGRRGDGVR